MVPIIAQVQIFVDKEANSHVEYAAMNDYELFQTERCTIYPISRP